MPKKPPPGREATVQVGLRLPQSLLERVDKHVERLRRDTRLLSVTRTEAMIALLVQGLEGAEKKREKR